VPALVRQDAAARIRLGTDRRGRTALILIIAAIVFATAAGIGAERRWPERAGHDSRRALIWILYLVLPPVTFFNLVHVSFDADLGGGIGLALVATAVAAAVAWFVGFHLLDLTRPQVGAVMACTLVANTAYLGYPLTIALLGSDQLGEAVAYDVAVGSPALLVGAFSAGAAFGTKAGVGARQRTAAFFARNLPLYAAILALLAPAALAPDLLVDLSRVIVVAILPVGFFAVGAALREDAGTAGLRLPPPLSRATALVIATKLVVLPALLCLLALPLIDLPDTYLLMALMPSGLNSMIVAHAYGLDLATTAEAVTWTTAIVVVVALVASLL
jgi:predicted permease